VPKQKIPINVAANKNNYHARLDWIKKNWTKPYIFLHHFMLWILCWVWYQLTTCVLKSYYCN